MGTGKAIGSRGKADEATRLLEEEGRERKPGGSLTLADIKRATETLAKHRAMPTRDEYHVFVHPKQARQMEMLAPPPKQPELVVCPLCVPPECPSKSVAHGYSDGGCTVCRGKGLVDKATAADAHLKGVVDNRSHVQRIRDELADDLQKTMGLGASGGGMPMNTPETRAQIGNVLQRKLAEMKARGCVSSHNLTVERDPLDPTAIIIKGGVQLPDDRNVRVSFDATDFDEG